MNTMRARPGWLFLAGAALALASAASASSAGEPSSPLRQCIDASYTSSWTAYDDHTILARSGGRSFLVTTNTCGRLAAPLTHIAVETWGSGPICGPHDARLYVSDGGGRIPTACFIQSIRPLAPDEVRALQSRKR